MTERPHSFGLKERSEQFEETIWMQTKKFAKLPQRICSFAHTYHSLNNILIFRLVVLVTICFNSLVYIYFYSRLINQCNEVINYSVTFSICSAIKFSCNWATDQFIVPSSKLLIYESINQRVDQLNASYGVLPLLNLLSPLKKCLRVYLKFTESYSAWRTTGLLQM